MDQKLEIIQENLGYRFNDVSLLKTALTHSSYANEKNTVCNERLEFLGDAVLGFVSANYFYNNYDVAEGEFVEALDIFKGLAKANPDAYQSDLAGILNNLANLHSHLDRYDVAEGEYAEALEIFRVLANETPVEYQIDVA